MERPGPILGPEPDRSNGCLNFLKITLLTLALLSYEFVSFVAFVSLSIGVGAFGKSMLRVLLNYQLDVALETFCSWYTLATCTEIHLKLYRKCVFPKIKTRLRKHPHALQGFPRAIYFLLYCVSIYVVYFEYEAVHNYRPLESAIKEGPHLKKHLNLNPVRTKRNGSHYLRTVASFHHYYESPRDFSPEASNEKLHTAIFLMVMSYIIYSSGQILCLFLLRILRGIPYSPIFPQFYAVLTMMILQIIMTTFYAFPLLMSLIACHMFHVDGFSTYLFTLCLALCVSMAAAQLESESPFPTQGRMAPYFYFEGQHRARINVIFLMLPIMAYYFFNRHHSYPLTAHDTNFTSFTFWLQLGLLHTIKSLYLTTWRPMNPIEFVVPAQDQLVNPAEVFHIGPILPYPNNPYNAFNQPPGVAPLIQNNGNNNNDNNGNNMGQGQGQGQGGPHSNSKIGPGTNMEADEISFTLMNERENETTRNSASPHSMSIIARTTSTLQDWLNPSGSSTNGLPGKTQEHSSSPNVEGQSQIQIQNVPPLTTEKHSTLTCPEEIQRSLHNDLANDNSVISPFKNTSDVDEIHKIFEEAHDGQEHGQTEASSVGVNITENLGSLSSSETKG